MTLPQTFPLTGMSCGSCVSKVTQRLQEHPDIAEAEVTLQPPQMRLQTRSPLSEEAINDWLKPLGKYRVPVTEPSLMATDQPQKNAQTYRPLIILLAYLLLVIAAASIMHGGFELSMAMRLFMGGFFIAFSFFKMLDLRGFSDAYRSYDLVAKALPAYGFVYPFIELGLGLGYLADWQPFWINLTTVVVMGVSLMGVLKAVLSRQAIRCACLGTVFNLPMSTVTIVEDALMLAMAIVAMVLPH
ncbi:MAG: MauE/DoxX family redox-associated membrane protein [Verrucomicrobiota bacterium]